MVAVDATESNVSNQIAQLVPRLSFFRVKVVNTWCCRNVSGKIHPTICSGYEIASENWNSTLFSFKKASILRYNMG